MYRALITALLLTPQLLIGQAQAKREMVPTNTWKVDPVHSEVGFTIRHFVSRVHGQFNKFEGTITGDLKDWSAAKVDFTIDVASINTNNERRDTHLRSADFFDTTKAKTITFQSTKIEKTGDSTFKITGDLTMKGVTKPVTLDGKLTGVTKAMNGLGLAGFEVSGTVNRMDYGVSWNKALEGGGTVLSDEVKLELSFEVDQQGTPKQ